MSDPESSSSMLRRSTRLVAAAITQTVSHSPTPPSAPLRRVRTVSKSTAVAEDRRVDGVPRRAAKRAKVEVAEAEEGVNGVTAKETGSSLRKRKSEKKTLPQEDEDTDIQETKRKRKGKKKKAEPEPEPSLSDFAPRPVSDWKLGAHVSAAGGVENTLVNAARIRANSFALFLKSQRKWTGPALTEESIAKFKLRLGSLGYSPQDILPHGSYLINLGNPDEGKRVKAYECFLEELQRCEELGLLLYNFHPGSTVGAVPMDTSLGYIAECLNRAHKETKSVVTVIENMAGAGNVIGSAFSDLGGIIKQVKDKSRVGVCLDTCHMFAAGYDIRTKDGWRAMMDEFDAEVGMQFLRGMHLNDSKCDLGSMKDRHENIGLGFLGLRTFHHILTDPRTRGLPLVMETPQYDDVAVWQKELEVLNRLSTLPHPDEEVLAGWTEEIRAVVKEASVAMERKKEATKVKMAARKRKAQDDVEVKEAELSELSDLTDEDEAELETQNTAA
ncbi:AP endonuclease [Gloeophyllum trabeum ATCC 11539]|uniref:Apurinic-apyrimidinic endonuclease 1 n=1 Tax=Gloeophyllum trabeum (strain ATCC 11539 / FP-39264 / Madison 617) TaxID=670483 RepID=S7QCV7_GLOTA|nr:AP endonuclease [Gloeophyllum trabeum ATCC 11539]EPQ57706.1 AP endonuclease [Gloeophyllum trabeum ATCC 11539]